MPFLSQTINWGSVKDNPALNRQLALAYTTTAIIVNLKVSKYYTDGMQKPHMDPPANSQFNNNFEIGDIFVRTDADKAWIMTSRVDLDNVIWKLIT